MLKFICYPKCTTCQKAKKWLDENHMEYDLRDIKADRPALEELTAWYKMSGLPLKRFFNTSGLLYKSLALKDKLPAMTEDEMLSLLSTDGMLVRRPFWVGDVFVLEGLKEAEGKKAFYPCFGKKKAPLMGRLLSVCRITLDFKRDSGLKILI